jgi:hypothetical protein
MENKNKALKRAYTQSHRRMGIYQIRNTGNGKVLIGSALDAPGVLNRHQFELKMGQHRNQSLQAEWHQFGGENFSFEILDEITPRENPAHDYQADLAFLEEFWLEKLQPYGNRGYNEKKKRREERLRLIARKRLS